MIVASRLAVLVSLMPLALAAQTPTPAPMSHDAAQHAAHHAHADSAYASMQQRGADVMGVDQNASVHVFAPTATGGVIRFTMRDTADSVSVATIRRHLRDAARAFARGDFAMPMAVHDTLVPGTTVMRREHRALRYAVRDVSGGGELRITATSMATRRAVREFLTYQTRDHRTDQPATP